MYTLSQDQAHLPIDCWRLSPKARFPFKRNRLRCVRCVNENCKKRKRLHWQAANHGCHCFDRAFLLASACVCCVKISVAHEAKRRCRRVERLYRRSQSAANRQAFHTARAAVRAAITRSRTDAVKQRFDEASGDAAATWRVVRDVLHRDQRIVHSDSQCETLASGFGQFFVDKLARIRQSIAASLLNSSGTVFHARQHTGSTLSLLAPTAAVEVLKLLTSRPLKSSPVDVLPSVLLRSCAAAFAPIIAHMANLSFAECRFPEAFKTAQVLSLLKKPGLDKELMSSYRPISNLTTISEVIERLALDMLCPHLLSSLNVALLQSAYRRGHSTETA